MKKTIAAMLASAAVIVIALLLTRTVPPAGMEPGPAQSAAPSEPAQTPEPTAAERAQALLDTMSPEEKAWQMLYVFPQNISSEHTCTDAEIWAECMPRFPAGGVVVNGENMSSAEQVAQMIGCIKDAAAVTPFIGVDEEGGKVARLAYTLGAVTDFKPMYTYREGGEETAFANAGTLGREIAAFGFNQDFAPVADVWTNAENTVIGERAYSDDAQEAARLVAAAVRGFSSGGVIATLKHFPGHGDTQEDSHYAAAHSAKTLEELRACELLPFTAGIEAGAGMVMTGHIIMDSMDPGIPATLSKKVVTELLRGELGWDGVVITDSFTMAAIAGQYDECDAAVLAIEAGCDMILGASDPQAVAQAILERVSSARIDESVLRILTLKVERGLADA